MSLPTGFDPAIARRWLGILHGDSPGHLLICSIDDWTGRAFTATQLDQAATYIAALDALGKEGIYLRVTSVSALPAPGKRGSAADSAALPALWADLDLAGPGHKDAGELPPNEAAGRAVIAATGLPEPTIWVHSGGGLYPIWLLDRPHPIDAGNLDAAKRLAKDWQRVIEHAAASLGWRYARGVGDLARVLRIPGTVNRKEGLARPCRIVGAGPNRYTFALLVDALDAAIARIAPEPVVAAPAQQLVGPLTPVTPRADPNGISPLDDYAERTAWSDILVPAGWHQHYEQDGVVYWTRPGKPTGTSASTNALGTDRLHVFTTSAAPLDGGESYSKGGAYAALYHGGDHSAAARELAAAGYGTPLPDPGIAHREALTDILGGPVPEPPPPPAPTGLRAWNPEIDASNPAIAADWLWAEAGQRKLAGLFKRGGAVVHTPREGEGGYVPLTDNDGDDDGPAQIHTVTDSTLASRISFTYGVFRLQKKGEDWEPIQALFPRSAARNVLDVPDMLPNLRSLRGVIHTPVFRPDGSLISNPGYDEATKLLHLPEAGLDIPRVPEEPTAGDVTDAVKLLLEMIDGFPFKDQHYRANYLGCLFTPLLRALAPPPYKLHAIEAHQPGSGKTLLANVARHIHGGVFRAEMPGDDTELRKQVTTILSVTTGPVVVIDNVSGVLKSSALAGLLTSDQWDDRLLGGNEWVNAVNDRLWTITGNNISIGGDLPRRTVRTVIDPGVPNPESRTGFAIADLERWVKDRRGELLHALLVVVRSWVASGRPVPPERTSDGYARWVRTVEGILAHAGIPGGFDHPSTQVEVGTDDDEWAGFLTAAQQAYGDALWTAKELLGNVDQGGLISTGPIPVDALPSELAEKAIRHPSGPVGIAKSLGRWLSNRDGRWAGGLVVRASGETRERVKQWRITTNDGGGNR